MTKNTFCVDHVAKNGPAPGDVHFDMFVEPSTQPLNAGISGLDLATLAAKRSVHAISGLRFFGGQGLALVECWAGGAARRSRFTPAPRLDFFSNKTLETVPCYKKVW